MAAKEAEARANTPYKSAEIMSLPVPRLIEILKDSNASEFAKAKACQRLAVVGGKTAVPALASLLGDQKLAHYARFGLEPIRDPSADEALRDPLGDPEGNLLIGVINSIGRRKDPKAVDALAKLMHGDDDDVAETARAALGRIRSPQLPDLTNVVPAETAPKLEGQCSELIQLYTVRTTPTMLTLLYRLLFLFYAESRDLWP